MYVGIGNVIVETDAGARYLYMLYNARFIIRAVLGGPDESAFVHIGHARAVAGVGEHGDDSGLHSLKIANEELVARCAGTLYPREVMPVQPELGLTYVYGLYYDWLSAGI